MAVYDVNPGHCAELENNRAEDRDGHIKKEADAEY